MTYHLQKLRHSFTGRRSDLEPVLYPLRAPFDGFCRLAGLETRVVDTKELDGLCVPPLSLVDGDEMKYPVIPNAMNGHPQSNSHGGG